MTEMKGGDKRTEESRGGGEREVNIGHEVYGRANTTTEENLPKRKMTGVTR